LSLNADIARPFDKSRKISGRANRTSNIEVSWGGFEEVGVGRFEILSLGRSTSLLLSPGTLNLLSLR
jgi:hypothetical protein